MVYIFITSIGLPPMQGFLTKEQTEKKIAIKWIKNKLTNFLVNRSVLT